MKKIMITENDEQGRLDKLLMRVFSLAPKGFIYKMLRKKNIVLNGKKADGSEILKNGDEITVFLSDETFDKFSKAKTINRQAGDIDILYEDENIIIVNKKAGVLSQPTDRSERDSVSERLVKYLADKGEYDPTDVSAFAPTICNRLDRNTSGIMLCAKNLPSTQELAAMLKERRAEKYYIAVAVGVLKDNGVITAHYVKDGEKNKAFIFSEPVLDSKEIITEFKTVKSAREYSLIRIKLVTGKSHQIRAVMASMGNPVVGDEKYGNRRVNDTLRERYGLRHQLLHAESVTFGLFSGRLNYLSDKSFECPPPEEFVKVLDAVGLGEK